MSESKRVSDKLLFQIRQVAVQYHNTRLLRSWMRFGLVTILLVITAVCLFSWVGIEGWNKVYTIAAFGLAEILFFVFLVMIPVRKPVNDEQIALHIEEYYPDLENRIISAQEFTKQQSDDHTWMIEQFFKESKDLTTKISFYDVIDSDQLVKFLMVTACFALIIAALFTGTYSLWVPHFPQAVNTVVQTFIDFDGFNVEPGNVRIKQGENQIVIVEAEDEMKTTAIRWRKVEQEDWEIAMMEANANQNAAYHQFGDVQSDIEYQVVFGDQTSDVFTIETWLPPKVESIDLTYTYPDYLNREQKIVPNSGEITAIEGTEVKIDVWVNKNLASVDMVFDEEHSLPLAESEEVLWSATVVLSEDGEYHLELRDDDGNENEIQITYKITVESDDPPEFSVKFPRDDMEVTMLEEVPFELSFADDYGLQDYGLQYEVAGQDAVRISLKDETHDPYNVEMSHRLALEELEVQPGDLITWNAWAEDQMPNRNQYDTYGDPFFIEIRPYRRLFKEAMTNAGAQQQQQQQQQQGQQQEQERDQKQIIIALWNLRKGFDEMTDEEFIEKRDAVHEAQTSVLEQAVENAQPESPHYQPMLDAANTVLNELETMEKPEPGESLSTAIQEAQMVHHRMIKMLPDEAEVQQSRQQQGGGGGGGGQQNQLADLEELEMNRERNFYEEENRTSAQQMEKTNEALDKLQELTQRQKSLNEEIAKLISEMQNDKDIEELERQLERLREEERNNLDSLDQLQSELAQGNLNTEEMRQAEQAMDEARQQMNETLSQLNEEQLQEARTSGSRAVSALNDMEDSLENLSRDASEQRMRRLQDQMQDIVEKQNDVISQINEIEDSQERSNGSLSDTSQENKEEIMQSKEELAQAFQELMDDATELSERSTESQELMSQKLGDWLRRTSQKGILEDIEEENQMPLLKYGIYDKALEREEALAEKIASTAQELNEAADFMVENDLEGMRRALAEMKELLNDQSNAVPGEAGIGDASRAIAMGANGDGEQQQGQGQQGQGQQGQGQQGQGQQGQGQQGQGQQGQGQQGQGQQGQGQQGQGQEGQGQQGQGQQGQGQQGQGQQGQGQQGQGQQGQGQQGQDGGRGGGNRANGDDNRNRNFGNGGGGWDNDVAPFEQFMPNIAEADLGQFMDEGYREWLDSLRNAEGLLSDNEQFRDDVMRIREEIEDMRREYRDEYSLPKYDLFIEKVAKPLAVTTAELQREINEMLKDQEVYIVDEGSVPYRYEQSVADYFKQLSEAETVQ